MFAVWVRRANNPQLDDLTPLHCNTSRYICDAHFADICKVNHLAKNARTNLKIHALPTLNMPGMFYNALIIVCLCQIHICLGI